MKPFLAALMFATLVPAQTPAAQDVARALQRKYDQVHSFTADFVHHYEGGVLRKKLTERGTVQVKKPGRMRWEYKVPEEKLFVSDGHKIYSYVPADKQVIVSNVPGDDQATTAVLFLAGKGNLTRDFTASFTSGGDAKTWALKLEPKTPQREYDWLVIVVDRDSMQIRALTAADNEGTRSTFQFSNLRENVDVPDKQFVFKIPRGADVITSGSSIP
ncbi:MAG: outer membrane lipoprotein carrier protein LolA [Acidobacteria bacterium]|nr:MAG: outer membrane lipoprotein carrier protein LolA [Acidobacteriota bacterium]